MPKHNISTIKIAISFLGLLASISLLVSGNGMEPVDVAEGRDIVVPELWFYLCYTTNERKGPLSTQVLTRLLEKGLLGINGETMIWKAGMEKWLRMIEVSSFGSSFRTCVLG